MRTGNIRRTKIERRYYVRRSNVERRGVPQVELGVERVCPHCGFQVQKSERRDSNPRCA